MICDFCRKEISQKPCVSKREISTSSGVAKITLNFCSRICVIAEKIMAVTTKKIRTLHKLPLDSKFYNEVKNEVMKSTGCTEEEYAKALDLYNSVVKLIDCPDEDMEEYL
jgi:hypothetical protein